MPTAAHPLRDPVDSFFDSGLSAPGTSTGAGETLPVVKSVSTLETAEGLDTKFFSLDCHGAGNMGEMLINLFFPNANGLGELPGCHGALFQEHDDSLSDCLHRVPRVASVV